MGRTDRYKNGPSDRVVPSCEILFILSKIGLKMHCLSSTTYISALSTSAPKNSFCCVWKRVTAGSIDFPMLPCGRYLVRY